MNSPAIESIDLWKVYHSEGRKIRALKGVSISVKPGTITTLLGRNGAGKTTFLRIAATQLMPTKGEIFVYGYDIIKDPWPVRENSCSPSRCETALIPFPTRICNSFAGNERLWF